MPFSLDPIPGDNEIECARCGALIYDQLSRCPNCGVNLYEPEDDGDLGLEAARTSFQVRWWHKVGGFLRRLFNRPYSAADVFGDSLNQAFFYNDLLQKVGGDHNVVERLIEFEKNLYPLGNRIVWLKNAIHRWQKDNRTSLQSD